MSWHQPGYMSTCWHGVNKLTEMVVSASLSLLLRAHRSAASPQATNKVEEINLHHPIHVMTLVRGA